MKIFPSIKNRSVYKGSDFSNSKVKQFKAIPPLAKNENGVIINESLYNKYVPAGEIDVQDKIQSYVKEVDLYSILQRVAVSGDTTLLNQREGIYADVSNVPDNFHDIMKAKSKADELFAKLSEEEKNAVLKYFNAFNDKSKTETKVPSEEKISTQEKEVK